MIVVDSNVIAYCWLNSAKTDVAQQVRLKDVDWHTPLLWRSEVRNILAGYIRRKELTVRQSTMVMERVEGELQGKEHIVESDAVLKVVEASDLSAYDSEFVALAAALGVPLVTEDRAILKAFPRKALAMEEFLR